MADSSIRPYRIQQRISNLRRKGILPLESGNSVDKTTVLRGLSTLYDSTGSIKQQWVKTDVPKQDFLEAFLEAVSTLSKETPVLANVPPITSFSDSLATLYISNDLHIGELMWDKESGKDWNVELATQTIRQAYDFLFECSPNSKIGIVCDLGE